ncbi:Arm DNA-binding domain-containing protein [Yersinia enterocolitica]
MSKTQYPTGVEHHGGYLRIWFMYQKKRCRESLGIPDTPKNRKVAADLRQSIGYAIKTGTFDYAKQFPDSLGAVQYATTQVRNITIQELFNKWLSLKEPEVSLNTHDRYTSTLKTAATLLGPDRQVSSIRNEDILKLRNELLNGMQLPRRHQINPVKGRSVPTVNYCLACVKSAFIFAASNGYADSDPTSTLTRLRKSKPQPDPLTRDEFFRMLDGCTHQQIKNLWTLAVYTGMRHGEICALAWEDVDLEAGTIMVRRNLTRVKQFTLPKTDAGTDRVIQLTDNAKETLRSQMLYTRMGPQYEILIHTREARKTRKDRCTFVFIPKVTSSNQICGDYYSTESLGQIWNNALRRSGIRSRKPYQSRHTFACWLLSAGANPSFIASQMGHASAQMVFSVYGEWMPDSNDEQMALINAKFSQNAPLMPHKKIG